MTHKVMFAREYDALRGQDFMTITLPSGRKLFYAKPFIGQNRFGGESICYSGVNQTSRKVETIETYGGKLTENITQAVARDCLAEISPRALSVWKRRAIRLSSMCMTKCASTSRKAAQISRTCAALWRSARNGRRIYRSKRKDM